MSDHRGGSDGSSFEVNVLFILQEPPQFSDTYQLRYTGDVADIRNLSLDY